MKKIFALLLALALTLTLAACGNTEEPAEDEPPVQEEVDQPEDEAAGEESPAAPENSSDGTETPAEDPAEETPAGEESSASDSGTGSAGSTGGSKPAGGQNTSGQKPAEEQPAQKPQQPPQDEAASQPTQPPAEDAAGTAPETPAEGTSSQVDLTAFAASVTSDQETWPALMAVEGESLDMLYGGLSAIATKQCVVQVAMISASGDEIALVEVENSDDVQAVKDIFQARIDYQVGDGTAPGGAWYPEPTEMWRSESRIVSNGNFVMLVAHTGADSVVEQFNALFA